MPAALPAFLSTAPLTRRHSAKVTFVVQATVHEVTDVPVLAGQCSLSWRLPPSTLPSAATTALLALPSAHSPTPTPAPTPAPAPSPAASAASAVPTPNPTPTPASASQEPPSPSAAPSPSRSHAGRWNRFLTSFPRRASGNSQPQPQPQPQPKPKPKPKPKPQHSAPAPSRPPAEPAPSPGSSRARRKSEVSGRSATDPLPLPPNPAWPAGGSSPATPHTLPWTKAPSKQRPLRPSESRGHTPGATVRSHAARFERTLIFAVRVPIRRPDSADKASSGRTGNGDHASGQETRKRTTSAADGTGSSTGAGTAPDSVLGELEATMLHLVVTQHFPQDSGRTEQELLGHADINLAEYAPPAPKTSHSHAHLSAHSLHHAKPKASDTRTDTRKFLLAEGKTNALLRVTLTIRRVAGGTGPGGAYTLPPISTGIPVAMWRPPNPVPGGSTKAAKAGTIASSRTAVGGMGDSSTAAHTVDGSDTASSYSFGAGSMFSRPVSARTAPAHLALPLGARAAARTRRPRTSGSAQDDPGGTGQASSTRIMAAPFDSAGWGVSSISNSRRSHGMDYGTDMSRPGDVSEAISVVDQIFAQTFADARHGPTTGAPEGQADPAVSPGKGANSSGSIRASSSYPHVPPATSKPDSISSPSSSNSSPRAAAKPFPTRSGSIAEVEKAPSLGAARRVRPSALTLPSGIKPGRSRVDSQNGHPPRWSPTSSHGRPGSANALSDVPASPRSLAPSATSVPCLFPGRDSPGLLGQTTLRRPSILSSKTVPALARPDPPAPVPEIPTPEELAPALPEPRARRPSGSSLFRLWRPKRPSRPSVQVTPPVEEEKSKPPVPSGVVNSSRSWDTRSAVVQAGQAASSIAAPQRPEPFFTLHGRPGLRRSLSSPVLHQEASAT